jgi:hypothetical protein
VLLARVIGLLVAVALAGCVLMYLVSGERKWLRTGWLIFKYALFLSVFGLLLIFAERLASEF